MVDKFAEEINRTGGTIRNGSAVSQREYLPTIIIIALLGVCLMHGLWLVHGLGLHTALGDTYRDSGFVQGIVDGNWFGDPNINGAWRYYPPLLHALWAVIVRITGIPPLPLMIAMAPWLNLMVPLSFYLMVRQLTNPEAAVIAVIVLVCVNGQILPPWATVTYSPWASTPGFAGILFFLGVSLISSWVERGRLIDAALTGTAIGITFLGHTVPAIILAAMVSGAVVATRGWRLAVLGWLGLAAAVALLLSLPFLFPLVAFYHLHTVNMVSAGFTDPLFDPTRLPRRLVISNLPLILALGLLLWQRWAGRHHSPMLSAKAWTILGVLIGLPLIFLFRHFICGLDYDATACRIFVLPVHHWMIYLQAGGAALLGYAAAPYLRAIAKYQSPWATLVIGAGFVIACALFIFRPMDTQMRHRALHQDHRFDFGFYHWLLANTTPNALFAITASVQRPTDDVSGDMGAFAIMAAGRKIVAPEAERSNPFVAWAPQAGRQSAYVAAASWAAPRSEALCALTAEAGSGADAYVVTDAGSAIRTDHLKLMFRDHENDVYRVVRCP